MRQWENFEADWRVYFLALSQNHFQSDTLRNYYNWL